MPDTPSITILKRCTYKSVLEEFGNTYHFSGTQPADLAAWKTLADAIIAAERPTMPADVEFVQAYGYNAGNDNSVAQIDYRVSPNVVLSGTGGFTGGGRNNLEVAATVRWPTPGFTSRGKRIYLRKYYHAVYTSVFPDMDKLLASQKATFATFAAKLIDGTLPGGFKYCGPQGAVASAPQVNDYTTTRELKRRGKRNPTP